MTKLNNKGMTTIEILLCFILIVIITVSMYTTISAFNEKRMLEEYKAQIYSYKNLLTKEIQDDFIKVGITHVSQEHTLSENTDTYIVNCDLKDGTKRSLKIEKKYAKSAYHMVGSTTSDDYFMIKYGTPDDMIEYPIPNLGEYINDYGHVVKDLSINNVLISVSEHNVLSIYIGFYHPELSTRYGINIVCPVNYISSGQDNSSGLNLY